MGCAGTNIWRKMWNGAAWDAAPTVIAGPDLCLPQLLAHPNTGVIFSGMYEDADTGDASVMQYIAGAWSAAASFWNGGNIDCQAGVLIHERVALAAERNGLTVFDWAEVLP
jgi:hypothetical protein